MPVMLSHAVLWCLTQLSDLSVESISKNMPTTVTTCNFPQFSNLWSVSISKFPSSDSDSFNLSRTDCHSVCFYHIRLLRSFCLLHSTICDGFVTTQNHSKTYLLTFSALWPPLSILLPFHQKAGGAVHLSFIYQSGATCHLAQLHMRLYLCLDKQSVRPVPNM